ncbi:hypothetical protein AX17_002357 [Amanita inopinata Kibby_2008]|nr:hypothetical protein AX17_002357 [Amanita inopinata Kibby_2008]
MGVKSLWNLLTPVGRPIMLETVEGKAMAIDSSIWIYQFQATMRDKDGRVLINAHVLGFLRRITKLLFYGIKPVFVFDGGAPALKKDTLNERRKKKSGAVTSHAKLAEKLLAARLRKEALDRVQGVPSTNKGKEKASTDKDKIVYLEDVDPSVPKAPPRKDANALVSTSSNASTKRKSNFYDHDPYRLPDIDLEAAVAKATTSVAPDPRLATEEELQTFIEEMRPEDFDVTSPEFRELPTEIQYEIIGDLRLKSRQTSHARLQKMLKSSRTAMDFSKAQIRNLRQRNALTQQLLITTDSIGSAHISIPVRIASERNKEYVLIKNEGDSGGWILGIRDHGTQEKPIEIDQDVDQSHSSDADLEEVEISVPAPIDRDAHYHNSEAALEAFGTRHIPGVLATPTSGPQLLSAKPKATPLFDLDDDDDCLLHQRVDFQSDEEMLSLAIEASLEDVHKTTIDDPLRVTVSAQASDIPESQSTVETVVNQYFASPSRLETVLSIANISPSRPKFARKNSSLFGRPSILSAMPDRDASSVAIADTYPNGPHKAYINVDVASTTMAFQEESCANLPPMISDASGSLSMPEGKASPELELINLDESHSLATSPLTDSDEDMEEIVPQPHDTPQVVDEPVVANNNDQNLEYLVPTSPKMDRVGSVLWHTSPVASSEASISLQVEEKIPWSRSPSPAERTSDSAAPGLAMDDNWDAAQEMDPHAEEGEFAKFLSQVRGRDLDQVRREIHDEIESLNQQRKVAMRDSEDVTQQMVAQIMTMLRLFGIPYITAPMEAEAQCAELASLGLVDGVITDDSDVFLFGAQRVFKNMFNQSKTVECFLLSDLGRELGLDRDTLVRLAYLLGSDYVEGLPGVGPVVAMELLKEFPGIDGLHKFKDWWIRVQSGKDTKEDNKSKFRQRFKKKFKDLYLESDWPNPAVRDAYYHPVVDNSDEPFKWGMPDLDGLRQFFNQELGWVQAKVDELLLPIIQRMNKRKQAAAVNKQGNLTEFFDVSTGTGAYVPRKRQAYASKRLQQVVSDFRKRQKSGSSTPEGGEEHQVEANSDSSSAREHINGPKKKRKTGQQRNSGSKRGRQGMTRGKGNKRKAAKALDTDDEDADTTDVAEVAAPNLSNSPTVQLRPRPRPAYKGPEHSTGEINQHAVV